MRQSHPVLHLLLGADIVASSLPSHIATAKHWSYPEPGLKFRSDRCSMATYRSTMVRFGNASLLATNRSLSGSFATIRTDYIISPGRRITSGFKIKNLYLIAAKYMKFSTKSSSVLTPQSSDPGEEIGLLPAMDDEHRGVIVEMKVAMSGDQFITSLRASLLNWKKQGKRGVWLKLPIDLANLVQPAVAEGFVYHHAESSYLMLVYWIPDTKNTLPVNATHRVGVGAFVMNDKGEVLAVQERSGKFRGSGVWKFPTGVVDQGEDIFDGAIREVKEETGVDTEFVEVLAFRQSHKSFFEKSDLFFVCMLRPLSTEIRKQESEIAAAQWIPMKEFAAQPFVQKHELMKSIIQVGCAKVERLYNGFSPVHYLLPGFISFKHSNNSGPNSSSNL